MTRLVGDININERLGYHNTTLIARYFELLPVIRPLVFFLKRWAKHLGLNNPSGRQGYGVSFSSYSLTLMTIGMFQVREIITFSLQSCLIVVRSF